MSPLRVLSVFGTRPEAIKMAPVVQALAGTPGVEPLVCVTAQHRQMLDQVLNLFGILPDIDLDLMRPDQSLAQLTAAVFNHLDPVLARVKPDWVLVQGDTTTVMAAAILAYYHRIRVGHVEAGLRTSDKWQPFPEEINRRVATVVTDLHFAPTEWARQNLLQESVPADHVLVTGNPVIDALHSVVNLPVPGEIRTLLQKLGVEDVSAPGESPGLAGPRLVLVTAHRRENFGQPMEDICQGLLHLAKLYDPKVHFIYPVHLNPNVQKPVYGILGNQPNITLLPPLDYLPWVHLIKRATLMLTDSGGLQEEAPGLGVPVLVLRRVTERPEGVEAGTVRLVGTDTGRIISETRRLLEDPVAHAAMANAANPYGDGHAAPRIVKAILEYEH
ncbi:MAG: UDP-N-acetylglucosamine 2-epimerase [Chloroflexi bacterium RBG_16_58_14]|nr:MAG: UDP-N-acetylglucosamine 2-epimerase [Chloroflexi bacterium RBG_16_58_14]